MRLLLSTLAICTAVSVSAQEAEVIHWWTSEGESHAVRSLAEAYTEAGGKWIDNAVAGASSARQASLTRIVAGDPPAASQFNTGREYEDLAEQGLLRDISDVAKAENWENTMPAELLKASQRDGKVYSMPMNIHGRNWIYYNTAVLKEAGATPPTGWGSDMFAALDKVKAAGKIPLALSGTSSYEASLFESILLDFGGAPLWYGLFRDASDDAFESPALRQTFETFARLRKYVDAGSPGRAWNASINMVVTGKAAFSSQGDWAKGEFIAANKVAGVDYGCILPNLTLQIGGDVFIFPKQHDEEKESAQTLLIQTLAKSETLRNFNARKGSIPPRWNVDMTGTDECAVMGSSALMSEDTNVPRVTMLQSSAVYGELKDLISEFWNDPSFDIDDAVERFAETIKNG